MESFPYTIEHDDRVDEWKVFYRGQQVGFGMLTFDQEIKAQALYAALREAYERGKSSSV